MSVKRILWAGIDPNYFASQFVFFFAVALYYSQYNKWFYLSCFSIVLSIVGSYSRSGFLVLAFCFLSCLPKHKNKNLLFSLSFLFSIVILMLSQDYIERLMSIGSNLIDKGGTGRFELIFMGLSVWFDNVFGVGLGNLRSTSLGLHSSYVETFSTHNTYFQILVESGVIIFLLFLYALFKVLYPKVNLNVGNYLSVGIIATLIMYFTLPVTDFIFLLLISCVYLTFLKPNDT